MYIKSRRFNLEFCNFEWEGTRDAANISTRKIRSTVVSFFSHFFFNFFSSLVRSIVNHTKISLYRFAGTNAKADAIPFGFLLENNASPLLPLAFKRTRDPLFNIVISGLVARVAVNIF